MYVCLRYKMKGSIRKVCLGCRWGRNYIYNSDIILPRVKAGTCSCAALQTVCKMCTCLFYMPVHTFSPRDSVPAMWSTWGAAFENGFRASPAVDFSYTNAAWSSMQRNKGVKMWKWLKAYAYLKRNVAHVNLWEPESSPPTRSLHTLGSSSRMCISHLTIVISNGESEAP